MNTFEFVRCSKKWCSSQFDEKFSKSSEGLLGSLFDVRSFKAKNKVFEFDHQQTNMFEFVRCSKNDVRVRSMFHKMVFDPSLLFWTLLKSAVCLHFQVEELQWRIKHNKELPPTKVFSPTSTSLPIAPSSLPPQSSPHQQTNSDCEVDNSSLTCNGDSTQHQTSPSTNTTTPPTIVMNNGTKVKE